MKAQTVAPPAPELEVTITMTHVEASQLASLLGMLGLIDYVRMFHHIGKGRAHGVDLDGLMYEMYDTLTDAL